MSGWLATLNLDGQPVDASLLKAMTDTMVYRGPDGSGTRVFGSVGLGHALFATLEDFPEPVGPFTLNGETWLVGDVRIDAREDLCARLSERIRTPLLTLPDAALVLHAYRAWGESCLEHLLGDFAFVIWDVTRQRLFCARDQMGIRPAYVARLGRSLVLSNTREAMRRHPAWTGRLDDSAIVDFLVFGELMDPEATGFASVSRLRAAHSMTVQDGDVSTKRYWTLPVESPIYRRRYGDYLEAIRDVLERAVRERLRSSRTALSMSGGLDSTSVAAIARRTKPQVLLHAFTNVFDWLIPDDERHFASIAAHHLKIPISFIPADDVDLYVDGSLMAAVVPLHDPNVGLVRRERQFMAGAGKVGLTGLGADPAFMPWPADLRLSVPGRRVSPMVQALVRQVVRRRSVPRLGLRWRRTWYARGTGTAIPSWLAPVHQAALNAEKRACLSQSQHAPAHPWRTNAFHYLTNEFWSRTLDGYDAGILGAQLSFAHPFLSVEVLRLLLRVPSSPFVGDKRVLRDAIARLLPSSVTERPKTPLRADPVRAAILKGGSDFVTRRPIHPTLESFVNRQDPQLLQRACAGDWIALAPYSLNAWLNSTDRKV